VPLLGVLVTWKPILFGTNIQAPLASLSTMASSSFVSLNYRILWIAAVVTHHGAHALFGKQKQEPPLVEAPTCEPSNPKGLLISLDALSLIFTGICAFLVYGTLTQQFQSQINNLQVKLSGKTNSAFLFIKPHACKGNPGMVEEVVEAGLRKAGIRITDRGEIKAETICAKMLIDTHYGAIASKAVELRPGQLNVPDKGQAAFKEMFGESWEEALDAGKVFNALEGGAKLKVDGAGMEAKWRKLQSGKNLIKFGGGFYCGRVDDIYVINAFYMSMRAGYCNPGEKIKWYTVSWPSESLSWADFRGKVLGTTDPAAAPEGSIRRTIYWQYNSLGLDSKPNTGNNGVHASASPLEGLAERMNWLGAKLEQDEFGQALLAQGMHPKMIRKWAADTQVAVEGETEPGKTMSVFDALEDLDADTVLAKVKKIGKLESLYE